jgi:hypothetical protein
MCHQRSAVDAKPRSRDKLLTALAVLMALLAFSNATKPISQAFSPDSSVGFVLFGHRLHGFANTVVGPLFGFILAAYVYGVWTMRRWVVPLAAGYAAYVVVNLVLFTMSDSMDPDTSLLAFLPYAVVAIAVSGGGAFYLYRNREQLS